MTDMEWTSWRQIPCPSAYRCPDERFANRWQSWLDEAFDLYCHAVANRSWHGSYIENIYANHLDDEIRIPYESPVGGRMLINASCDRTHSTNTISSTYSLVCHRSDLPGGDAEWSFNSSKR